MLQESLTDLFTRDLNKLKDEIKAYTNEVDLWKTADGISNSGGNLCLHLVGNMKHFIGKILGNIPYERAREKEFGDKNIPSPVLLQYVEETLDAVTKTIPALSNEDLQKIFPVDVFHIQMTTEAFLLHLYGHLNYHLGQVNYHRRLLNR